jgi:hypothetical protein
MLSELLKGKGEKVEKEASQGGRLRFSSSEANRRLLSGGCGWVSEIFLIRQWMGRGRVSTENLDVLVVVAIDRHRK